MPIDFTVIIPTYNGESRLPQLFDRLRNQINTEPISWEIILVDNNSIDNTKELIETYQQSWDYNYSLSYLFESKQGAGYARRAGVEAAQGLLIGFLDDDNYPALDWVSAAFSFGTLHKSAGAYASRVHPEYEVNPPSDFDRIAPFLAITNFGHYSRLYKKSSNLLPPSAGIVIRKSAWVQCVPNKLILNGKTRKNIVASEDLEMLAYIQKSEWDIWYNASMEIYHRIPAFRLERDYLIPFFRGIGLSRYVTRMVGKRAFHKAILFAAYLVNDSRKICCHWIRYRGQLKTNLVAACQMELYKSSFISFFYLQKNHYFD